MNTSSSTDGTPGNHAIDPATNNRHLSPCTSRAAPPLHLPSSSATTLSSGIAGPSIPPRMPVSPPTPAPSPRPRPRDQPSSSLDANQAMSTDEDDALDDSRLDLTDVSAPAPGAETMSPQGASSSSTWNSVDPQSLTRAATLLLPTLPSSSRLTLVSDLLMLLTPAELAQIAALVSSRLRVDFLSALPIEVSLHILSYIEDPLTLARAGQVSRFWRSLVNDEHTWEAMCSKYRYRYRIPSRAQSSLPHASGGTNKSGTDLLASLYRRYRQRGLDPSNARDELRTLHDLFLAKQQHQHQQHQGGINSGDSSKIGISRHPGTTPLTIPAMSSADLRFYEQLEEIVQEESTERYGVGASYSDRSLAASPATALSPAIRHETDSTASRMGWLSAGPPATRFPRTPRGSTQSLLPALNTGPLHLGFEAGATSSTRTSNPPAATSTFSSWTGGLGLPWGLSELISLPASLTGGANAPPAGASNRPSAAIGSRAAGGSSRLATTAGRRTTSDQWRSQEASSTGPIDAVGMGLPSSLGSRSGLRAATYAAGMPAGEGFFSYKAHFKRNYLTESNWHRGGRLLTNHVSNGGDPTCTCIAMDERYLIIGMANGNIHIFDARSGLYERSIRGRPENGVWCIVLVSKTKGVKKDKKASKEGVGAKGKGKQSTAPEPPPYTARQDAQGQTVHVTTHDDLTLVKHDSRLNEEISSWEQGQSSKRKRSHHLKGRAKVSASEGGDDEHGDDQTLHWFHQARKALQQGATGLSLSGLSDRASSAAEGEGPAVRREEAFAHNRMIGGLPRDLVEAGPEFVRHSMLAQVRRSGSSLSTEERERWESKVQHLEEELTRIRKEHGITGHRAIPRPGPRLDRRETRTGKTRGDEGDTDMDDEESESPSATRKAFRYVDGEPMDEDEAGLADGDQGEEGGTDEEEEDDECSSTSASEDYQGFSMGIGGTANGLGTLCGATRGFGNSSALLVSGGCDRDVKVWDVATGQLKFTMQGHASTVRCLRVLDGRPIAISGGRDSTVRVWDISTGTSLRVLAGHQNSVRCLEVAGNRVATGSYDCTCRIWNIDTGECLHVLRGHYNQIYCVGFDGNKVATGSLDSTVRIWSAESGEPLALLQGHTALVGVLQLANNVLISGGSDGRIIAYSLTDLSLLYAICAHDNSVSSLQFDEHFILTGGNDGTVRLWNLRDGSFIRELVKPGDSIWKLGFREDRVIVVCKEADASLSMEYLDFRPVEGVVEEVDLPLGTGRGATTGVQQAASQSYVQW